VYRSPLLTELQHVAMAFIRHGLTDDVMPRHTDRYQHQRISELRDVTAPVTPTAAFSRRRLVVVRAAQSHTRRHVVSDDSTHQRAVAVP